MYVCFSLVVFVQQKELKHLILWFSFFLSVFFFSNRLNNRYTEKNTKQKFKASIKGKRNNSELIIFLVIIQLLLFPLNRGWKLFMKWSVRFGHRTLLFHPFVFILFSPIYACRFAVIFFFICINLTNITAQYTRKKKHLTQLALKTELRRGREKARDVEGDSVQNRHTKRTI